MPPEFFFLEKEKREEEQRGRNARNDSEVVVACARNHSDTKTGICLAQTLDRRFELIKEVGERLLAICESGLPSEKVIRETSPGY
jgi:hypothetical protein